MVDDYTKLDFVTLLKINEDSSVFIVKEVAKSRLVMQSTINIISNKSLSSKNILLEKPQSGGLLVEYEQKLTRRRSSVGATCKFFYKYINAE